MWPTAVNLCWMMRWRIQWRHCISSTLQPGKLRIPQITLTRRHTDTHRNRQAERQRQRNVDAYTINHIWHDIPTPLWSTEQKCLTSSNTFFCIFWIEHLRAILGNLQPCHNLFITVNHRKCWSILVLSLYRVMPCLWKRNEIFFILIHHRKR